MSLVNKVSVNSRYTRSINIERDASSIELAKGYIPTTRAVSTISRFVDTLNAEKTPRAWSLVGPYGSGKSSFLLYLSNALATEKNECLDLLEAYNPDINKKLCTKLTSSTGYLRVLVTGSHQGLARSILSSLFKSLTSYLIENHTTSKSLTSQLSAIIEQSKISTSDVIDAFKATQNAFKSSKKIRCPGVLLCIDELGKFLEFEALQSEANDIYLLQELAEHAYADHDVNLNLFVSLHHSLEHYAKGLGDTLKHEWSKVQGRFEEIPFLESSEQTLRVVSNAIQADFCEEDRHLVHTITNSIVKTLHEEHALPHGLNVDEANQLFSSCYPLHPLTALILPTLCQKVAQNERTLFSYLSSHEDSAFQHVIKQLKGIGEFIMPGDVFDYFMSNRSGVMGDHITNRRWVEVSTAIDRLDYKSEIELELLKTVGLLNVIGSNRGIKASEPILKTCCKSPEEFKEGVKALEASSLITYRKFNSEYRVWQGSDFDLESCIHDEVSKIKAYSVAKALNNSSYIDPIVARRYTIQNGALRYFLPRFFDSAAELAQASFEEPTVAYVLSNTSQNKAEITDNSASHSAFAVIALCSSTPRLKQLLVEEQALNQIENQYQELNSDPIAKKEFVERKNAILVAQQNMLEQLLQHPENSLWFWKGEQVSIRSKRKFQEILSNIFEEIYCKAPSIHNELINRDKPSSQAVAGRNKLLIAMLESESHSDLDIDKFPPEKAIYRAVLKTTGLHQEVEGEYKFIEPEAGSEFDQTWKAIRNFFATTEDSPRSFTELTKTLSAPPYGIKLGLLPIVYFAAYLIDRHELALYEDRKYIPSIQPDHLERFSRKPDSFTVQRFRIEGLKASIYEEYSKALFSNKNQRTIVQLVSPLAKFMFELPEYTLKTKSSVLSKEAKAVRDAYQLAKSPEALLFSELPKALGYKLNKSSESCELEGFAEKLRNALRELKHAFPQLIEHQKTLLGQAFNIEYSSLEELRKIIVGRYSGLEQYTVDVDGLKAFLIRLTKTNIDDESWLQNILMFLGHKPAKKWSDGNRAEAEVRLSDFSKRLLDLETLRVHSDRYQQKSSGDFDVFLLKSVKKGAEPLDRVITIDKQQHSAIQDIKQEILNFLKDGDTKHEIQLAVLAELVDEFLSSSKNNGSKDTSAPLKEVSSGK
ncbi:MAG: hypothetical protein CSA60_01330 [Neptuniibacter caesariensis]|uniref:ATP-binding protein n=1 Tax=Neptuniibacter caesariensis TaxID=207954 RepID=A0A2G6JR94_NEPCE|nr:MAG: hypothetical protein CSA60_01330 [Neptuniibacter caesariensis]